jgi:hypothetical protein
VIVCCEKENCIGGGTERDDFILVFVEVRVVVNEEDRVLEGEKVRQGHGAEIGDVNGKEDLEETHDDEQTLPVTLTRSKFSCLL